MLRTSSTRRAAATESTSGAASPELGSDGAPVIGIGGFIGSDPYPTLQQFQQYVKDGDIHYFISTGPGGGGMPDPAGAGGVGSQIATWVAAHYTGRSSDGYTVYDLTQPAK